MTTPLAGSDLIDSLKWRYATKRFDPSRKLPVEIWKSLEEALVLTPSSYGLQAWNFLVIESPHLRQQLRAKSWNQSQVEDASHFVVFTALRELNEPYVDRFIDRAAQVRGVTPDSLSGYRRAIVGDAITGPRAKIAPEWNARQVYIALGNLMTSAALLGVDTCPLEGLDPLAYDAILGLENSPFKTIVACALGYRHPEDKYASSPKVRFEKSEVIRYL